ncbi:MAG: DNA polymerase Y family protein [Geminicoccaceae bacterium]
MSRRWLSLWLPDWPLERARLAAARCGRPFPPDDRPLALLLERQGGPRLHAVNRAAHGLGLGVGMRLADARAACPGLTVEPADPAADARGLEALALWCGRWSPWPAPDGEDGIVLDITGCAHLFGGEQGLLGDIAGRLQRLGLLHRAAIADRLAAAWAWARFGNGDVLASGTAERHLLALPVRALRLDGELVAALTRLGLRTIGDIAGMPRAALLTRFGGALVARLDALLGQGSEAFVPLRAPQSFAARLAWPEPIGRTEDIAAACARLLTDLCGELERAQRGARRFRLSLWRLDGEAIRLDARTGRPVRSARHVERLFGLQWDGLDVGFGIELMHLEALETAPLGAAQAGLAAAEDEAALALLIDQLAQRLGEARVVRPEPRPSHIPARAQALVPAAAEPGAGDWLASQPRPLRLFPGEEPVQALAMLPDSPPVRVDWRGRSHRIVAADGPERILPEWWRDGEAAARPCDFYRVADEEGRRFWLCREGLYGEPLPPRWRMVGMFQ